MHIYYYPNRPILIPPDPDNPSNPKPDYINGLEAQGKYIAEQKWNGDNCLIYTDSKGTIEAWNRHKEKFTRPVPGSLLNEMQQFKPNSIVNGEWVGAKTKNVKDLFIVHCIMMWDNKLLLGKTWGDSRKIIEDSIQTGNHVIVSSISRTGFWDLFQTRTGLVYGKVIEDKDSCLIEGIVLKDPTGKLVYSTKKLADVSYMLKIRHPSNKYSF